MLVQRFAKNTTGRNLIVGDIHGSYSLLVDGLHRINFDQKNDRLFALGDTIDRGPESPRALAFLAAPFTFSVLGNHEAMILEIYQDGIPSEDILRFATSRNGMSWWMTLPQDQRLDMVDAFKKLPIVIEVETQRGRVGLLHGEVPIGMDWPTFIAKIEAGDEEVIQQALWGRTRATKRDESGVKGIDRVFVGHTPVNHAHRLGNVYFLDTGAVFGALNGNNPAVGRLTMAELTCGTACFGPSDLTGMIDFRLNTAKLDTPFGVYANIK